MEKECINWLKTYYPLEGRSSKENTRTHVQYIEHCINKKEQNLGVWDDSPRFFYEAFNTLMSKSMEHAVHPTEDRYFNAREMMHLMGLPHDFEIDSIKSINHIAQVRNIPTLFKNENEWQKTEPVPIQLPKASRNFPTMSKQFFF